MGINYFAELGKIKDALEKAERDARWDRRLAASRKASEELTKQLAHERATKTGIFAPVKSLPKRDQEFDYDGDGGREYRDYLDDNR